jgi:hypothetical protein
LTVVETRTFNNGKSPVRINQTASKIIPRFPPVRVFVTDIYFLLSNYEALKSKGTAPDLFL